MQVYGVAVYEVFLSSEAAYRQRQDRFDWVNGFFIKVRHNTC